MQRVVLSLWPLPFNSSSPAEVNVIPACFLRQREKLHHTVGSPEIKKETDTQMQLQLSLPDLHSCTVLQDPSLDPSAFFLFLFLHSSSLSWLNLTVRSSQLQMIWEVYFPPASSHLLTQGRDITVALQGKTTELHRQMCLACHCPRG